MIFSAWFELHNDDVVVAYPTAIRVYAVLLRNPLIFFLPQDVKAWVVAHTLHTHQDRVNDSLNLLAERGYLIEHGRGLNNVRRITVPMERQAVSTLPRNEGAPKSA